MQSIRVAHGVLPAVLTPLNGDGSANITLLEQHCRRLLAQGCSGIVLLGTTGEANSFTVLERRQILEGVVASGIAAEKLIVGTGCCAVGDTVDLTRHALSLGVARALVLPPFYYKNVSDQGLFVAFASIVDRIDDGRLRLFLYSIPQVSGIPLGVDLIERLHKSYPGVIAGLKDSSGHWQTTQELCLRLGASMHVMVGTEALLLKAMAAGASGCISATANVAAPAIIRLYEKRDEAEAAEIESGVNATRAAFEDFPIIPALKAYMAATTGLDAWRAVRPPLRSLSAEQSDQLLSKLDKARIGTS